MGVPGSRRAARFRRATPRKAFDIGGMLQGLSDAANAGPNSPLAGLGKILGGG
jgi:hypothetical protein